MGVLRVRVYASMVDLVTGEATGGKFSSARRRHGRPPRTNENAAADKKLRWQEKMKPDVAARYCTVQYSSRGNLPTDPFLLE